LVILLYQGLKLTKRVKVKGQRKLITKFYTLTPKYLRRHGILFITRLRIARGLATYTEIRRFLCSYTKSNELFTIPSDERGLSALLKEVLSKGMVGLAQSSNNRALSLYNDLREYSMNILQIEDINELYYQPFFHAIFNHVYRVENALKQYISTEKADIYGALKHVSYVDLDTLTSFRRNPLIFTGYVDKLFNNALKAIKEAPEEIYYGSATDSLFAFNRRELLLSQEVLNNCYCENNDLDKTICEKECDAPTVIRRSDLTQRELSVDDLTSSYSTIQ
jgi:hypothetical protein